MSIRYEVHQLNNELAGAVQRTKPWVSALGRAGYVARAVLYLTIGGLAALTAFGEGGRLTDGQGALEELYRQPLGVGLISLMSVGLAGYGVWLAVKAAVNPANEASGRWASFQRAGWLMDALLHFGLAAYAAALLMGSAEKTDAQSSTASALNFGTAGPLFVTLCGAGLIGYGLYEMFCAWRAELDQRLDLSSLTPPVRRSVVQLCRIGVAARSVVLMICGVFLVSAGMTDNPARAKSFGDSLQLLRLAPYGQALLLAAALGVIAFGVYQLVEARFRRLFSRL